MTFDEIPLKMMQLGVDRAWLAQQCDYKPGTLAAILAPNGSQSNKTDKALRRIWEALEREELRQKRPAVQEAVCQIVVRPEVADFTRWNKAALSKQKTVEDWAIEALNKAAAQGIYTQVDAPISKVATDETPYKVKRP